MATHSRDADPLAYDNLPASFKDEGQGGLTRQQWAWLSPQERQRYIDNETEPEGDQ